MSITVAPPLKSSSGNTGHFHWTVDTFYRAIAADIFDEPKRFELANGELWEKENLHPSHATGLRRVGRVLRQLFAPLFLINEEKPLHIANDSEPVTFMLSLGERKILKNGIPIKKMSSSLSRLRIRRWTGIQARRLYFMRERA